MKYFIPSLLLLITINVSASPTMTLNFDKKASEPTWKSVNDGVMGGLSKGNAEMKEGILHFKGSISLRNNGGFSSIRTSGSQWDMSEANGISLRVRGDGRKYQLRLATDALFRGSPISYGASFETTKDEWKTVFIPFSKLKPSWRGRTLSGPDINLKKIKELGILIGDKKEGAFQLEIDWMKTAEK